MDGLLNWKDKSKGGRGIFVVRCPKDHVEDFRDAVDHESKPPLGRLSLVTEKRGEVTTFKLSWNGVASAADVQLAVESTMQDIKLAKAAPPPAPPPTISADPLPPTASAAAVALIPSDLKREEEAEERAKVLYVPKPRGHISSTSDPLPFSEKPTYYGWWPRAPGNVADILAPVDICDGNATAPSAEGHAFRDFACKRFKWKPEFAEWVVPSPELNATLAKALSSPHARERFQERFIATAEDELHRCLNSLESGIKRCMAYTKRVSVHTLDWNMFLTADCRRFISYKAKGRKTPRYKPLEPAHLKSALLAVDEAVKARGSVHASTQEAANAVIKALNEGSYTWEAVDSLFVLTERICMIFSKNGRWLITVYEARS